MFGALLTRARAFFLLSPLALLLVSCGGGYVPPDLSGVDVRLTLLHTSDIHSRVLAYDMVPQLTDENLGLLEENGPFGGAPRMATVLKEQRAKSKRVLHLDSGDVFQGAPIFNVFQGEVEMLMHNQLGTDVVVAGNHEFDEGARNYASQLEQFSTFRTLAANYDFASADDPWNSRLDALIDPTAIIDLDGLTVGVVGMGNLSSITSITDADNSMDVRPLDTMSTVMHYTAMLKPQVDVVIVLTHLSLDDDEEIARTDPNVDVVLGGHLHVALDPVKVIHSEVTPGKDVVVCHAGAFAKYIQRLDLVVRDGKVIAHDNLLVPIDARIPEDADTVDMLEDYERELEDTIDLRRAVATTTDRLRRFGNNGGDSPLGNLVAEAMQYRAGIETDFALTNSLGIRTDIQGPGSGQQEHQVNVEELFNVLPFENTITTMFLSGDEVQALFDYVAERSAGRGCGSQAQIASARFVMDCSNEVALDVTVGGSWDDCITDDDCEDPGEICSALRCGRAIEPSESYELSTNNFIAAGGSGFEVLENNTTQQDSGISMRDAVEFYMLQISEGGTIPLNDIYTAGDGRITPRL
ncbi:MAG: bifunctional metallophosphatase/5'-nucleotidase [Deltaproteobacteria bacterium]|nr:bifunctional metallophosphatase/5'-nucleotidase [Deltaproteobacteria bacterium]